MKHFKQLFSEKILLTFLLLISVALNVYFAYQVHESRYTLSIYLKTRKLALGEPAPPLVAYAENGSEVNFDFSGKSISTVLYLNSYRCHWCQENSKNIEEMATQAAGKYNLLVVNMEDPQAGQPSPRDVANVQHLYKPSLESRIGLDLTSTPTTLFLSSDGKVLKILKGAYTKQLEIEIEKDLGITLSGLPEEKSAL